MIVVITYLEAEMTSFRWLHLTDLHCGMTADVWLWPNVSQAFFEDLRSLHDKTGPWDALLFSGDLVQRGTMNEYDRFNEILTRVYSHLDRLGSRPTLLTVPGNHDLNRPSSNHPTLGEILAWSDHADVPRNFWQDRRTATRRLIQTSFRYYTKWQTTHHFPKPARFRLGLFPGEFAATIDKDDTQIGILGLNTSFCQLQAGDFEGKLLLSPFQMVAACGDMFTDWVEKHSVCLLMTHHPASWLTAESRRLLREEIAPPGRFAAHICGHLHESYQESLSIGASEYSRVWQGCSLFGLEAFGESGKVERRHGYMVGQMELSQIAGILDSGRVGRKSIREVIGIL